VFLKPLNRTLLLEQFLLTVVYGSEIDLNETMWKNAVLPLLIDKEAAKAIVGNKAMCSSWCLNEEEGNDYKFIDRSRFELIRCGHHSFHI